MPDLDSFIVCCLIQYTYIDLISILILIFSKIDVSNKLIIVAFIITSKTRSFYDLFKKRVISLNDIIIDDNILKYELSIDKNNKNNINFLIIIEKEKVER